MFPLFSFAATTPVALLASYWNLPIFSQASTDPVLEDKSVFKTLVRLGPPFNKMGSALVGFYQKYNWTRTVVISKKRTDNRNVFCDYSYRSVEVAFQDNGIEIADYIPIYEDISDVEIDRVLDRARQRGRGKVINMTRRQILDSSILKEFADDICNLS